MTDHTPIPWEYREGLALVVPVTGEGCIASLSGGVMSEAERKENGLLIVRACNSHERLLTLCKKSAWWQRNDLGRDEDSTAEFIEELDAGIAEAGEGT